MRRNGPPANKEQLLIMHTVQKIIKSGKGSGKTIGVCLSVMKNFQTRAGKEENCTPTDKSTFSTFFYYELIRSSEVPSSYNFTEYFVGQTNKQTNNKRKKKTNEDSSFFYGYYSSACGLSHCFSSLCLGIPVLDLLPSEGWKAEST